MTGYFDRMPPFIRERIHAEGWTSWRGVQEDSFRVLFDCDSHLLITAGTSSGKTEAAMLPVISSLYDDPPDGVGALYIGPTKALIDDQFSRLDRFLRDSGVAVAGWHGDISQASKDRVREDPEGILQITPESLQGLVCGGYDQLARMFRGLRFVVIDEVHAFMASDRGLQLLCELDMIERVSGCSPRRIGLSATLSDLGSAREWLRAGTSRRVDAVSSPGDTAGRVGIKHFTIPATDEERRMPVLDFYTELFRLTDPYSCIVFTNSRTVAERTTRSLARISEAKGSANPVRIHHGSISGTLRREAEADLKGGRHPTVVATSTLELGVDVGGLDRVVQIGAPYTCSSMLQRMGRTGRRGGRREMIVMCVDDLSRWSPSPPGMSLDLVRAVAVADLAVRRGWSEPIRSNPLPFGLLYHQMMAYLKGSDHDVHWPELRDAMLSMWAFRNMSPDEVRELARHLLSIGHLQRMEDGTLLIGMAAEPVVNGKGFAAVFETVAETEIRSEGKVVGTVQKAPKAGARVCLGGKVWEITKAGDGWAEAREVHEAAEDGRWESSPPEVDGAVAARMREVLASDEQFPWLDSNARHTLEASREEFASGMDGAVEVPGGFVVFPWLGTRDFEGMLRALNDLDGVDVVTSASPVWIRISTPMTWSMVEEGLRDLVEHADGEDFVLMDDIEDMGKYERYVPEGLRAREFAAHRLGFGFVRGRRRRRPCHQIRDADGGPMDDRALSRLSIAISLIWLLLIVVRLALYSSFYLDTPRGQLFSAVFNIVLAIGMLLVAYLWAAPVYRRRRAAGHADGYCQQCYARMDPGETFCPRCGWERKRVVR